MCNVEIQDALAKEDKRPGGMEVFVINTAKLSRERERQRQEGVARKKRLGCEDVLPSRCSTKFAA